VDRPAAGADGRYGSVRITLISSNLISADLVSSELSGREATQFAVAAANPNAALYIGRAAHVKADIESGDDPSSKPILIGRSHGELSRFTATQFS